METIFMNTENHKMNEPDKFVLNLLQSLDMKFQYTFCSLKLIYLLHVEKYKKTVQEQ